MKIYPECPKKFKHALRPGMAAGKLSTRFILRENQFETIMEQEIYPSSFAETHPAFDWPEYYYAGNRIADHFNGDRQLGGTIGYHPSIPKSWEKRVEG